MRDVEKSRRTKIDPLITGEDMAKVDIGKGDEEGRRGQITHLSSITVIQIIISYYYLQSLSCPGHILSHIDSEGWIPVFSSYYAHKYFRRCH